MATGRLEGETDEQRRERMHRLAERSAAVRRERKQARAAKPSSGPQSRMAASVEEIVSDETSALATLQAVIDDPKALHSDRIRAVEAQQRILQRVAAEQAEEKHGALVALRQALDALPLEARAPALSSLLRLTPLRPAPTTPPLEGAARRAASDG